jgi:hypothetical protein
VVEAPGHQVSLDVVGEDLDGAERVEGVDGVEVVDHEAGDRALVDELAQRGVGSISPP